MTSTISSNKFSEFKSIYSWSFKKSRGILILYGTLLLLAMPLVVFLRLQSLKNQILQQQSYPNHNVYPSYGPQDFTLNFSSTLRTVIPFLVIPLVLLFSIILAVTLYRYMHQKRSTDLFHSLPIGRTPLLLGRCFAGLTVLFIPLAVNFLISVLIAQGYGAELSWSTIWWVITNFLWILLMTAAAFSFLTLMAVCSGTSFDTIISTIIINISYPDVYKRQMFTSIGYKCELFEGILFSYIDKFP